MKMLRYLGAVLVVLLAGVLAPSTAAAAPPPDLLESYTIAITPQPDGMLAMEYTLHGYQAMSDWPSDQPYLQIGVPNPYFSITGYGSSGTVNVSNVEAVNSNGSFVQFDFGSLPRNGDVFDLHFAILQGKMAYPDTAHNQVTFMFIPAGWTFPISVRQLTVSWANPDPSLLRLVQPSPGNAPTAMTWTAYNPKISSGMFRDQTIQLAYDQSAYNLSDAARADTNAANGATGSGGTGNSGNPLGILGFLAVIGVFGYNLFRTFRGDNYRGGPGVRPGGGYFYGGGHSCACAGCACACACACAGGGKVGCSRKAIGIACLPKVTGTLADRT